MVKGRIIVVKDVFRSGDNKIKDFNGYHAIVYAGIQLFYNNALDEINTNLNILYQKSNIEDKRTKKNIKQAFNDLVRWELISLNRGCSIRSDDNMVVSIHIIRSRYTTINTNFILKILKSEHQVDFKGNMVLVYIILAQYIGGNNYGYPTIDTIAKDAKLSHSTIISVLNNLRDMEIIVYATATRSYNRLSNSIYVLCDEPNCDEILDNAINNPDELLSWYEVERRKDIDTGVYLLHMFDENEGFYKVGISVDVNRRVEQLEYYYNVEVIDIIHTNLNRAIKLENQLQSENRINKYYPKKHFSGHTECFSELPLSYNTIKERYNE